MDSSRKGCAPLARRWTGIVAGSLCATSLFWGGWSRGQDVPQPVLNPFIKVRPAAARPSANTKAAEEKPAAAAGLKPALIRPVVLEPAVDAQASSSSEARPIANPHVARAAETKAADTKAAESKAAEGKTTEADGAEDRPAPQMIWTKAAPKPVKLQPAAPTIINEAVQPGRLPELTEEEHLAPIIPASAMPRRPGQKKPSSSEPAPAAQPKAAQPISPWMTDVRQAQKAAATEELGSSTPLHIEASASGEPTTAEPTAAEPAPIEATPLAPIVSADNISRLKAPQAEQPTPSRTEEPMPPRARVQQFDNRKAPRALVVQNEAQPREPKPAAAEPAPAGSALPEGSPFEMIKESGALTVQVRRSLLLRTQKDVYRTAVVDDSICEIVQFTPRELSIIGRSTGSTHVTFWFDDKDMQPVTYVVTVTPDVAKVHEEESKYRMLEDVLNEMFPDSKIKLTLVADKLLVRGQAKDSEEAFQIMTIVRAQAGFHGTPGSIWNAGINEGQAAQVLADTVTGTARRTNYQVINMLRVPGVQQVALRVKIAELNRSAARNFGLDITGSIDITDSSKILLNSLSASTTAGQPPPILFNIDGDDLSIGINALQEHGVVKLLSEPTLVTMSGRPATFLAGGEFAVPTVVGTNGLAISPAVTDFRAFGAIISFLPTVVDKDRIRLEVAPEFSEISRDQRTTVNSIPGLNVRAATTTVEMREGQTLAIAGLLQDSMTANNAGDLPFLQRIIGRRSVTRNENELIILVTPELVHPMEPEEVPPLPGFDVTEPTSAQFYLHGDIEGNPTMDYRSTVWPRLKKRYKAGGPAMTSGPFGHGQ